MANILVVFTGGTIGSTLNSKGNIAPTDQKLLISKYSEIAEENHSFDILEPFTVLSENMTVEHWNLLFDAVNSVDESKYDGIIITHGSDTVSYTAAMGSYLLRHKACPVVFIAANYILDDPKSNGLENFKSAIDLITDDKIKRGVFVCYKDIENSVYLASRLCEADPFADKFSSFNKETLGKIEKGRFVLNPSSTNPALEEINAPKERLLVKKLENNVAIIKAYPGLDYDRINITGLKAVLNLGYHSATFCTQGDGTSFYKFAKRLKEQNVDVYISSFKAEEGLIYESLDQTVKLDNVHKLVNISPEAVFAKLILAYSTENLGFIKENLYYEIIKR